MKEINLITSLHTKTKRNYIERMVNQKSKCMTISKRYSFDYWDGKRKYGYGGYKYIPGRWTGVARKLIKIFKLNNNSRVLDVGCGKGFLLYEIKKILPNVKIVGLDISKYGIKNSKKEIKKYLKFYNIEKKLKFKEKYFDLVISLNTLHNLKVNYLFNAIKEIQRVGRKHYICVESYRNDKELFNLQCWALTCVSFFSKSEWMWIMKNSGYTGRFEFIYFVQLHKFDF